ncbi:transposase [Streptomyces sp. NPDC059862]|uniref:transposase n=1 Tax=unclassified Streptomyces TaxID=2593676 RepID=UPI00362E4BA0
MQRPWLQFAENLSDRAAADAVRTRIDWKYALGLELDDPGFDHSVLCEFRARLAKNGAVDRRLEAMLDRLRGPACSRPVGGSAPTPPTSWPRSAS